jgi:hypothetical protein
MRRLTEDERHEHSNLLHLTPRERLFVQRWMELFDRQAIRGVRCRLFSPSKLLHEIGNHHQPDFHVPIMNDELSVQALTSLADFRFEIVQSEPITLAESLAASVSALGFDHGFLFHAYKAMLYPRTESFQNRLEKLRQWWLENSTSRPIEVVLRTTKGGMAPPPGSSLQPVRWNSVSSHLRDCAQRSSDWWSANKQFAENNDVFLSVTTSACDPTSAAAIAVERHSHYSIFEAAAAGKKAVLIDRAWALVDDAQQSPHSRTYALRLDNYRFRLKPPLDLDQVSELNKATAADKDFAKFWHHYSRAIEDIRNGDPNEALDDVAKALDLAYSGYSRTTSEANQGWKAARLFVEKSAVLLALDWCRTHYQYVLEYVLKPSYSMKNDRLFGDELRPHKIFAKMSDDASWESAMTLCSWDELLRFRRNKMVEEFASLSSVLPRERRRARWDLARAIRARNSLFHRGEPLQDQYLLAVFLDTFDVILKVRLAAHKYKLTFNDLIHAADQDYSALSTGAPLTPYPNMFISFGWLGWKLQSNAV